MEMHRVQDVTKDGSGWYFGKSTKGSFSVLLPIPFNDFTITASDPNIGEIITHGIGSKSSEGVKFTVSEMVRTKRTKDPKLELTVEQFKSPKSQVLEINYANYLDFPSVTFSVSKDTSGAFVRFIKTPKSLITMILEYPKAQAGLAMEMRATFLDSLRITEQ